MTTLNPGEKHIACVLLVDTSGSMQEGGAIDELNEGLRLFGEALKDDVVACGCADVCVISFDSTVETVVPFCPAEDYNSPQLKAGGLTALNEAIITGLDAIELRKQQYKNLGTQYWRPWLFLLTDGIPTDDREWKNDALNRLQEAHREKKVNFFPMAIGANAAVSNMKQYTKDGNGMVLSASKENFKEAFVWLSSSMSVISNSDPTLKKAEMSPIPNTITIEL